MKTIFEKINSRGKREVVELGDITSSKDGMIITVDWAFNREALCSFEKEASKQGSTLDQYLSEMVKSSVVKRLKKEGYLK